MCWTLFWLPFMPFITETTRDTSNMFENQDRKFHNIRIPKKKPDQNFVGPMMTSLSLKRTIKTIVDMLCTQTELYKEVH